MISFIYHYVGNVANIALGALFTLTLSTTFGSELFGQYTHITSILALSTVMTGFGITTYCQKVLPKAKRLKLVIISRVVTFKVILISLFYICYSFYDNNLENLGVLYLYLIILGLSSIFYDNVLLYLGYLKTIFLLRFSSNTLKLLSLFILNIDIDTVLLVIIAIECVNIVISVVSIKLREKKVKLWRTFQFRKDYNVVWGYRNVFFGNALSFFSTHSFVILVFVQLGYTYQSVGAFAFISGFSYLAFSAISIPSRYESIWVSNSIKINKPYYDRKLLIFHVVMFYSILISMYIFKNPIIEYVFKDQYGELFDYIYLILMSFLLSGFSYSLSPVIILERKFYAFSLSSIIPLMPSLVIFFYSEDIYSGFWYLFSISILKSVVLNVICYKSNKEIIRSNVEIFLVTSVISTIILFISREYDVTHIILKTIVIDSFFILFATSLPILIFLLIVQYGSYIFFSRFKKYMSNI